MVSGAPVTGACRWRPQHCGRDGQPQWRRGDAGARGAGRRAGGRDVRRGSDPRSVAQPVHERREVHVQRRDPAARQRRSTRVRHLIAETNRIHLLLFGMQNRKFGLYLAAIDGILISVMRCAVALAARSAMLMAAQGAVEGLACGGLVPRVGLVFRV
jgi:hypothetical protein